ncbi:hypothetical protein GP486_005411 [Trichoglossum hirsutum]|uniref:Uncharacterized protein n=1 Tax=Trichoglossum hirsutum TaxID=265104 RepID=A0A9P8L9B2_9PEZI|nr:hypothetical protein GP486_005411 [Trichoglossum hirsutum]
MSTPIDNNDASSTPLEDTTQRHPPPTPSIAAETRSMSVARIFELFRQHKKGLFWEVGSAWVEVPLLYEEYCELEQAMEKDDDIWGCVQGKIRYEYDYAARKMVIRYPNHHYYTFIREIINDITNQLMHVRSSDNEAAGVAKNVLLLGSVNMTEYQQEHYADASFRHTTFFNHIKRWVFRIVIEVSFPPKRKYLPYLAHDYIVKSKGNVDLVVGLDIDHWGSKKASVSMWRSRSTRRDGNGEEVWTCEQTLKNDYFRSEDGSAVEEGSLAFQLRDFVPPWTTDAYQIAGLDIPISIPYSKLAEYLDYAERKSAESEQWRERHGIPAARRPMM